MFDEMVLNYEEPWQLQQAALVSISDGYVTKPEDIGYRESVEMADITREMHRYADLLERLGVTVHMFPIPAKPTLLPNIIFASDNMFSYQNTIYLPAMRHRTRRPEPMWLERHLTYNTYRMPGAWPIESSDVLVYPNFCLVGIGNRTTPYAAGYFARLLDRPVYTIRVPSGIQHLMGVIRPFACDKVAVRSTLLSKQDLKILHVMFNTVIHVAESYEVTEQEAFNFVPINPYEIIMPSDTPETEAFLKNFGIKIHTTDITNLRKAGGGLACLTGRIR